MLRSNCSSFLNENRCLFGFCTCPKEYDLYKNNEIYYNALTLPMIAAILYDLPLLRYVYGFIFILLASIGIINNICSLMTFIRERIRYTICGIYLINYSICSLILMMLIITNILTAIYYDIYLFRFWACYGYPYLSLIMVYTSMLISIAIAIEGVFYIYFNFNKFRPRRQPVIISLLFLLIVSISNLDKIFGRSLLIDQSGNFYCTYKKNSFKYWSIALYYIYIITPCLIHGICIICVLVLLIKENGLRKIIIHQIYFIPSLFIIFCMLLNSLYLNLFNFCLTFSSTYIIRLHIIFIFLLYTPQIFTYAIYVIPNNFYVKEFYQIWFFRKLCFSCYTKRRHIQEFEVIHMLWTRRTSLETIKTISTLNDMCNDSEFYKNIKMEF
ncbi:unnamed protein product [Rotaria sp. Silwood2]|nr:unnamed protein product [Rotaria sp. Silwood2]CAF2745079.1 unnamed protein product [Rotaria sp. Silwood2]CAF3979732.1 unnamed protein product [Rotaria sp. Silwood2]CAF4162450.1 unnamed protein product [Rotaria sp. Silwood2]